MPRRGEFEGPPPGAEEVNKKPEPAEKLDDVNSNTIQEQAWKKFTRDSNTRLFTDPETGEVWGTQPAIAKELGGGGHSVTFGRYTRGIRTIPGPQGSTLYSLRAARGALG